MFDVQVLLATFNGERFLHYFLDSLVGQKGVRVHLLVSDDGSSDSTLEILSNYEKKFASFALLLGPRKGPAENFFYLLRNSSYEYVAFADQDDVWNDDHLFLSVGRLMYFHSEPALTFSALEEFSESNREIRHVWPGTIQCESIIQILAENPARGCTMVMNGRARNLINLHSPSNAIMHDWWCLLVIFSCGKVIWSNDFEIQYRIHEANTIGTNPSLMRRFSRLLIVVQNRSWAPVIQAEEVYNHYRTLMSDHNRHQLGSWLNQLNSKFLSGKFLAVFYPGKYRSSLPSDYVVRLLILLHKNSSIQNVRSLITVIRAKIRHLVAKVTFYVFSVPVRFRTWKSIRIQRKCSNFNIVLERKFAQESRNFMIFACYPRLETTASSIRVLNACLAANYQVILVINGSPFSENFKNELSKLTFPNLVIIERENIGRDFGAYQCGFTYLKSRGLLENINRLGFVNDSVIYGPRSEHVIVDFLSNSSKNPWSSLFVNYQFHQHAQSFLLDFGGDIVRNEKFIGFWENYYPSELRHLVINKGEVELSRLCLNMGYSPHAFYRFGVLEQILEASELTLDELKSIWIGTNTLPLQDICFDESNILMKISKIFHENNVTHYLGLLLTRLLSAPLKLDILQTPHASIEGIENSLLSTGMDIEELEVILNSIKLRGTVASVRGFRRLWRNYGYA